MQHDACYVKSMSGRCQIYVSVCHAMVCCFMLCLSCNVMLCYVVLFKPLPKRLLASPPPPQGPRMFTGAHIAQKEDDATAAFIVKFSQLQTHCGGVGWKVLRCRVYPQFLRPLGAVDHTRSGTRLKRNNGSRKK